MIEKPVYVVYRNGQKVFESGNDELAMRVAKTIYDYDMETKGDPFRYVSVRKFIRTVDSKTVYKLGGYYGD